MTLPSLHALSTRPHAPSSLEHAAAIGVAYTGDPWTLVIEQSIESHITGPKHVVHITLKDGEITNSLLRNDLRGALTKRFQHLFDPSGEEQWKTVIGGRYFSKCSNPSEGDVQWKWTTSLPPANSEVPNAPPSVSLLPGKESWQFLVKAFGVPLDAAYKEGGDSVRLGSKEYAWRQDALSDRREGVRVEWRLGPPATPATLVSEDRGLLREWFGA